MIRPDHGLILILVRRHETLIHFAAVFVAGGLAIATGLLSGWSDGVIGSAAIGAVIAALLTVDTVAERRSSPQAKARRESRAAARA